MSNLVRQSELRRIQSCAQMPRLTCGQIRHLQGNAGPSYLLTSITKRQPRHLPEKRR